ncbi:MAG TPA: MFS transporter [Pseudonocardiaceae bacterium]|jgi:DHA2 family methylenomycin A resistance protein-like MFS transporter|nr:MFS transporter [Pseudonocardiaceae bacterium]
MSSRRLDQQSAQRPEHAGRAGSRLPLIALCLGYFMVTMDATVVNTALPAIGRDLSAPVSGLQWITAGYTLVFACLLLTGGSLGDRLGSRRVFLVGVAVFTLASAACGLSPGLGVLIGARAVQGVGAALAVPTSLALINASYPDRDQRARAIGMWGGLGGVAAGLGPVLGGMLTNWVGWPAIFFINVPIGIAAIALTSKHVVAPAPTRRAGPDLPGQVLSMVAVAALAYGLIEAQSQGWTSPRILGAFIVAIAAAVGFVLVERRGQHPMLPLRLFGDREFSGSLLIGAAINLGFYGELFLLALYFQDVRHFSPLLAGLAMLPQPGIASLASWLAGRHTARIGPRPVMLVGLTVGSLGLLTTIFAAADTPYWLLVLPLLAIGFGTAYTMPAATAATIEAAPANQAGTASGALNASRQVGSTLGVAIFGTLAAGSASFMTGYHRSALVGGLVFAAGALIALVSGHRRGAADAPT